MKVRVYIRDKEMGKLHGIGWICPSCLSFHNDIEEAKRKNAMFSKKEVVPKNNYVLELLHHNSKEDEDI